LITIIVKAMDEIHPAMTAHTLTRRALDAIEQIRPLDRPIIFKMTFKQNTT
jgi:hypothetical protein